MSKKSLHDKNINIHKTYGKFILLDFFFIILIFIKVLINGKQSRNCI